MDSGWREILREHRYERYSLRSGCSCKQFGTTLEANEKKCFEEWLDHIEEIERQKPKTRGKGMEHFPVPDDDYENWRIGVGLPPQRSMTPEEVASMRAYRETKFKRVPAQDDWRPFISQELHDLALRIGKGFVGQVDRGEFINHIAMELLAHDAVLKESVREEFARECQRFHNECKGKCTCCRAEDAEELRASMREECADAAMEAFGHNETNLPHSDGCIACAVKQAILALREDVSCEVPHVY